MSEPWERIGWRHVAEVNYRRWAATRENLDLSIAAHKRTKAELKRLLKSKGK